MGQPLVMTAPLALIKVHTPNGLKTIGKMKSIVVNETFQRAKVVGLGQLYADEMPVTAWQGTLSCEFYSINFIESQFPGAMVRTTNNGFEEFTDNVLLQEDGLVVDILKRIKDNTATNRFGEEYIVSNGKLAVFARIQGLFLNQEGFNISEGQIASRNQQFDYTTPITFL